MKTWMIENAPFFALMAAHPPANRPMLTRIIEQSTVAIIAAALTLYTTQQRQADQIANLTAQAHRDREEWRTEQRNISAKIDSLTMMVAELRYPRK